MVSSKTRRKAPTATHVAGKVKNGRAGSHPKATSASEDKGVARPSAKSNAKPGSKQAILVERLCRPSGAGIADLVKTLGWLPHTVRAAVTGVRKKGFIVTCTKDAQGQSVYRATRPAKEPARSRSTAKPATAGAA